MGDLKLYLFGMPRLERDGEQLPISRRKGLALLAYLALLRQPQSREALATLLWPDFDQSRALSNLRREMSRLKGDLHLELLEADRRQVSPAGDLSLWVDVNEFRRRLGVLARHDHYFPTEPCSECQMALAEAVTLYTDRFMAGFNLPDAPGFDDWQFFEAESLSRTYGDALQRLLHWHRGASQYEKAIDYGRRWLALDTLHEPAHRELMALYARAGQQAAALRQYEECARLLDEELGIAPEAETTALYEAIRSRRFPGEEGGKPGPWTEQAPLPQGRDRYELGERIAVGGQGEVFLGRDVVSGTQVIIKRLRPEVAADSARVARFWREIKALSQLDHPNIVRMLDTFEQDGQQCIVMEHVPGGTLADRLQEQAPLPVEQVLAMALELADALGRAHHLGIIHRDLKPSNVLLTAAGEPRLTDFGTARLVREEVRLTQTGMLVGSPAYMSPEALRGDDLDARSDIWSFGILLYEQLAGRRPFAGESITEVLVGILTEPVPPLLSFRHDVPPALAALIEQMLVKDVASRPASMRQVAAALETIQAAAPAGGERVATPALTPGTAPARGTPTATPLPARPFAPADQRIHFTQSADGTRIAYAVVGQGPPLLKVANPLTHLQYDWESPVWRHWVEELRREHTLIRYDERGCGLSDRQVADISMEAWVRDLEAVVDALGLERFPIIGTSQGASVAVAYAVRHPERVSHLIFHGGYARGRLRRDLTTAQRAEAETLVNLIRVGWGQESHAFRQVFATLFVPDGTPEQQQWFTELARITAEPETAARMELAFFDIDVTDLAPQVDIPTLVLHARGDQMVPFAEGRLLAELIPGARFIPLEGNNHLPLNYEPAWVQFLDEVRRFLRTPGASHSRRWSGFSAPEMPSPAAPSLLRQEIRFCRAPDGVQIAYATVGEGPPLVKASNWLSHLEYDWQSLVWHHWLAGLAQHHRLIRYDERGCGLSDWDAADLSFEAWVRDLESVVAAVGVERFPLLGISQGAAIAIAYASRHPERVSHLILYGGYARGGVLRGNNQDETRLLADLIRFGWGREQTAFRQVFSSLFLPEGTPAQFEAFNELQRVSSSPENAALLFEEFSRIEVSDLAAQLEVPTLVLHARGDLRVPFTEGRYLASVVPGARFVPLESRNHILLAHEPAWAQFLEEVHRFLQTPGAGTSRQWSGFAPSPAKADDRPQDAYAAPFAGRELELAWLQEALEAAVAGQGRVCFVAGEAGQGKSTLLQAFIQQAQARHPRLVAATGYCNAYTGQGDAQLPFREILQLLTGDVAQDIAGRATGTYTQRLLAVTPHTLEALVEAGPQLLETFLPARPLLRRMATQTPSGAPWLAALQSLAAAAVGAEAAPLSPPSALFSQYAAVLEAVARRWPLLLCLDDLQWSDQGSASLLLHLGKRLAQLPILIVGAYRPAEVTPGRAGERHPLQQVVHELQRDYGPIVLDLGESEGRKFVDALLDAQPNRLDDRFRATLYAQTQGHPLFTVELLRGMQQRGDLLRATDGAWIASSQIDWETLPARVEGAIGERIDRLELRLRELLELASVAGETFSLELLAELAERDPRELARIFGQELDRTHRLVQAVGVRREGQRRLSVYRFRHILIQRYLYQSLDDVERTHRHEAVAEALEALYGADAPTIAADLARHFVAAELPARAAAYYRYAGDQARRAAALEQALDDYERALSAWPEDDDAGRADLLRRLGECAWIAGQLGLALGHFQAAHDLYRHLDDRTGAGATQRAIGRLYWEQGDRQRSLDHYEQALALLEQGPETVELARAYSSMSQMHMLAWEHDDAVSWGERALALARRLDAPDVLSHALNNVGFASFWLGEQENAINLLRESKALALDHHLPHDAGRAFYNLASAQAALDRYDEAQREFGAMLQHAQRWGVPLYAGSALAELVSLEWLTGQWETALGRRPDIQEWLRRSEALTYLEVLNNLIRADMANTLGQPTEALSLLEASTPAVERTDEGQVWMPFLKERIRALAALGRHEEVAAAVRQLLARARPGFAIHSDSLMALHAACSWAAEQGYSAEAEAAFGAIEAIADRRGSRMSAAVVQECRGLIALCANRRDDAAGLFGEAADGWLQLGRPYDEARARASLALALGRAGRAEEAEAARARAAELLDGLASQLDDGPALAAFRASPLRRSLAQAGRAPGDVR